MTEDQRYAAGLPETPLGEADAHGFDELCGYDAVFMDCHERVPFCHVVAAS
jgi:hypothetical protein